MSIIEEIKRDVRHDETCIVSLADWANREGISDYQSHNPDVHCNCTRRDKIALLDRLQEPKPAMVYAALNEIGLNNFGPAAMKEAVKAAIKAAEEAQ